MLASTTEEFESFLTAHLPIAASCFLAEGESVDGWRVTAFLGKGGSGEVYRVECEADATVAALKVLVPRPGKTDSQENSARLRFEREARLLSGNSYSFFPRFHGGGEVRGCPYFVLELLEPSPLPSGDSAVAAFMLEVAAAVRVLHLHGLVHRDLKPQNLMRRANGELVIIDLGLVKECAADPASTGSSVTMVDGKPVGVGTPRYAAPEQFFGGAVSPATDIHALGLLADECFGGRPPRDWVRIIRRSTSSIPGQRYASAEEFAAAVRHRHYGRNAVRLFVALAAVVVIGSILNWSLGLNCGTTISDRWRWWRLSDNVATYTVLRLDGRRHDFSTPITLKSGHHYWVVGPGTLAAPINGESGAILHLDNCILLNLTRNNLAECGIKYVFQPGAYLNFVNQENMYESHHPYIEEFDSAYNDLRYGGPETREGLLNLKHEEARRLNEEYFRNPEKYRRQL